MASKYFHCDVSKVNGDLWRGYIRELDYSFDATTKNLAEHEAYRIIEECEGYHSFHVIYNEV